MSKASEWATKLALAGAALSDVRAERPEGCDVYVGDAWLKGRVGESGRPQIVMERGGVEVSPGGEVRAENMRFLLDFARWILATFGDEPTAASRPA